MSQVIRSVFFVLACTLAISATIKIRYTVPRYHEYQHQVKAGDSILVDDVMIRPSVDTLITVKGSENANEEFVRESYLKLVYEGAWTGYDAVTAWDGASLENIDQAPSVVDAVVWVDSMYEPRNNDGSYVLNVDKLRNSQNEVSSYGFIAFLFGGIKFPVSGTYTLVTGGDDGGTPFEIDIDNDGVFEAKTGDIIKIDSMDQSLVPTFDSNWKKFRLIQQVTVESGKYYKFRARYYNYSEISMSGLFWKKPDGTFEIVGPEAFGLRKQFGIPVSHIIKVEKGGTEVPLSQLSFLEIACEPLKFTASAENMLGVAGQFVWNFGDGTAEVTTADSFVTHMFSKDDESFGFAPRVRVIRGERTSRFNSETILVIPGEKCSTAVAMNRASRKQSAMRFQYGKMLLTPKDGERVSIRICSLAGALVHQKHFVGDGREVSFPYAQLSLTNGAFVVSVIRNGKLGESVSLLINR